jgi:hypothetical protein
MSTWIDSRLYIKRNADGTFDLVEQQGGAVEYSCFTTYDQAAEKRDMVNHDRDRDAGMLRWTQRGPIMGSED